MLVFSNSDIQTSGIIQKSKLDTFISECVLFSAYRHPALQRELKQNIDQSKFKTETLHIYKTIHQRKERKFIKFIEYKISRETSKMVPCDVCNEWYRNSCIDFQPSFTLYVPLFICSYCIDSRIYHFIPFLSLTSVIYWIQNVLVENSASMSS